MIERDDMAFSMAEHRRRLDGLRARMAERRLDAAIISDPENLAYLTEYQTTGYSYFQSLVVPADDEPFMVTRRLEATNVDARTWVEHVYPYPDSGDAIETLRFALNERGLERATLGYERGSYFLPAHHQDRLRLALEEAHLIDCFGIVEAGRIVKSEEELAVMARAAVAAEAGMTAGLAAIRPGVTENDVAAEVSAAMFRAGGEYPAVMPYITSGPRTMIGHATWEGRKIEGNDCVFLEVAGCYRRYHTALMRTAVAGGDPSDALLAAEARRLRAREALFDFIRPGVTAGEVDQMAQDLLGSDDEDGGRLVTRAGYAIGIAFAPSWDEGYILSLKAGEQTPLRPGMTLHVIPWLWGVDGRAVMASSETVAVTEDGCRSFFDLPPGLHRAA